ncbi:putative lipoprotein [Leptospira inadai serovar Lyme str. 10]|uniref:Lipoprotein n=2 Tax=Leptospira inadai serovar Lyme TaxID=293084 RepID=A0ABX4YGT4_9LEPT|nr:hypothetical protein [Leptospira inadai]EQA38300.1 putative lipoprotein [Leptospira inadai serovar Lyme str. 10]PNV74399.1 hypothetical protein BES34_013615 [Leptospira inadai serovar Lyme]
MKSTVIKTLIIALAIGLVGCSNKGKTNDSDYSGLLASILAAPTADGTKSVVKITQLDSVSWSGVCFDSFTLPNSLAIPSGTDFFNATLGALQNAPPLVLEKPSKSTCSALGFPGGITQRSTDNNFFYKVYYCNPDVGVCTFSAIQAAGF